MAELACKRHDPPCVVLLTGAGGGSGVLCRELRLHLGAEVRIEVVEESKESRLHLIRRRITRLGLTTTFGQVLFSLFVPPILRAFSQGRIQELQMELSGQGVPTPPDAIHRFHSVNSSDTSKVLRSLRPAVVVVHGTRILARSTLRSTASIFLNLHAGITPEYRGVHGGYWALVEGKPEKVGSTVHLVDEGIDTGRVVERVVFRTESRDNFATYPYLHLRAGIPPLLRAVTSILDGVPLKPQAEIGTKSVLRYHPTLWGYLRAGLGRGVW